MRNIRLWTIALGAIVLCGGGVAAVTFYYSDGPKREQPPEKVYQVKFVLPRKGALERLCVQPGSVHSFENIQLYAKVPGFLDYQHVDIGHRVKKDEVLAKIYVPDIEAQVDRNRAAVERAESVLKQMHARVKVAEANVTASDAEVEYAKQMIKVYEPTLEYRKIQLERMVKLAKKNAIEDRIVDESTERRDAAKEMLIAGKVKVVVSLANVEAAKAKVEQARADVKEAEAEIKVAQAELDKSEVNLKFATITAPFDGVITYRSMNPGDFVRAANKSGTIRPLLSIVRKDKFRVVFLAPDRDVAFIKVGMPAMLKIDSLPGLTFYPKVSRFSEALDAHTRLMRVELDLYHDQDSKICSAEELSKVYHDMYGQVTIVLDKGKDMLSIPTSCLAGKVEDGKGSVYVIRSGKAKKIDLKVGMDSGLRIAVEKVLTKGETLTEEDQVIVEPANELAKQPAVTAVSWDDSSTITLTKTER